MIDKNNILRRLVSGIVIIILFGISIFLYRFVFYVLMLIISGLMLIEWYNMVNKKELGIYHLIGLVLITVPIVSICLISTLDPSGYILLTLFLSIAAVDTMAMIGGKILGGPKLAPKISPNKTISGLITGVLSACICINLLTIIPNYQLPYLLQNNRLLLTGGVLLVSIVAQISDLLVSYFKRKFKIKDSGNIIPGHGGALDRFDSIILTAPIFALYLISSLH